MPTATVVLQGNDYYSAGGPWSIEWGAMAYHSLASWRTATSEETVAGQKTGATANPDLTGPVLGLQMDVATSQPGAGNGFVLRAGSPTARCGPYPGTLRAETRVCQLQGKTDVGSASECRSTVALNRKNSAMGGTSETGLRPRRAGPQPTWNEATQPSG